MIHNMIAGGGTALNFQVTGNPQPANPKENTVWVDTESPITGWVFSPRQPETAAEGCVWIKTGTDGTTEFNALKKNGIQLCPVGAKQYVGGAWVDKDAQIYQDGAWKSWWAGELYDGGDECTAVTGGWMPYAMSYVENVTAVEPRITKSGGAVRVDIGQGGANGGVYITKNKIPFSGKTALVFTGTAGGDSTERCCVGIWSQLQRDFAQNRAATYNFPAGFSGEASLDVSALEGEYFVGIHVYGLSNGWVSMEQLKLQ